MDILSGVFDYDKEEDVGSDMYCFYNVVFLEDFGVFKKGEELPKVIVSYIEGWINEGFFDGTKYREQEFKAVPIN